MDTSGCLYGDIYCDVAMKPKLIALGITLGTYNIRRRCFEACDVPNRETYLKLTQLRGVDHNLVNPKDHPDWWSAREDNDRIEEVLEEIEVPF